MPDQLDLKSFTSHTGSPFTFHDTQRAVTLHLMEVQDRRTPSTRAGAAGECFSLRFSGPVDAPLEQDTYRVEHGRLGAFDMFIVPIGADAQGRYYEAIFNRMAG